MENEPRVEREVFLPARPDDTWAALTEPERLSAWFGAVAEGHPDGSITFRWPDGRTRRAVIDVAERERLLVLRWLPFEHDAIGGVTQKRATKVLFVLSPHEEGTHLRVSEMPVGVLESRAVVATGKR